MLDLSIVIVSWNARKFLIDCLKSIAATAPPLAQEVIVVDNGSTDGSAEAVAADHPGVRLIRNEANLGFARGNNLGLAAAEGRYVALINSDVLLRDGCLQRLVRYLDEHPRVGIVGPRVLNADGTLQFSCWDFPSVAGTLARSLALDTLARRSALGARFTMRDWPTDAEHAAEALSGCIVVARREAVQSVGPLDEAYFFYAEDQDWCLRFRRAGWEIRYDPLAEAVHFGGGSSSGQTARYAVEYERANLYYWRKHHGRLGQAWYAIMILLHHGLRLLSRGILYALRSSRRMALREKISADAACLTWLLGMRSSAPEASLRPVADAKITVPRAGASGSAEPWAEISRGR
jgi:GT2 family glycosyltransferase